MTKSTRKKSKKSVLVSQKPKRKSRSKFSAKSFIIILAIPLLAAAAYWSVLKVWHRPGSINSSLSRSSTAAENSKVAVVPKPIKWKIGIVLEGDKSLKNRLTEKIMNLASSALGQGSAAEMQEAAEIVQQEASFEKVSIIKTGENSATIYLKRRQPIMCIEADKLRLVTSSGDIYGDPLLENCPGPILTGVFQDRELRFVTKKDMTLAVTQSERDIIKDSSELLDGLSTRNYKVDKIEFYKFRGFGITIKELGTLVTIGQAPFTPHLDRLDKIVANLKSKNQIAERIELDYQGKAFIKLKKL